MTSYAEVQGTTMIVYPYTFASLQAENIYTNYGSNTDFVSIFPGTDTAIKNGYTLAPVTILAQPAYNPLTQSIAQDAAPTLVDGVWTLGWTVTNLSADQVKANVTAQLVAQAPIVAASYAAGLQRAANKLQAKGQTWEAVNLLLQAKGIQP
jgi:hypothetical protein